MDAEAYRETLTRREPVTGVLTNELAAKARLEIRDGRIHYRLYQQDGTMQPMDCPDTPSNRLCVSWFQAHDRYTPGGDGANEGEGGSPEGGV